MRYTTFHIQNYKGIKDLSLDLERSPDFKIYSLVGLNESGKTTILEAINNISNPTPLESQYELIPKNEAGGFNGSVKISATISIDESDKSKISEYINEELGRMHEIAIEDSLTYSCEYKFRNSEAQSEAYRFYSSFVKYKRTKSAKQYKKLDDSESDDVWRYVKKNLFPEIIFYRDFLAKFPERIAIDDSVIDESNDEYKNIVEDILKSINSSYNIENSLLKRLKNPTDSNLQSLEAVTNQLEMKMSNVIFTAWSKIQNVSKKDINIKTEKGTDERYYLRIRIKDGQDSYSVAERSLGFRWFFTFLLFTEFRKERVKTSGEILFLLDEPASNLHQSAQMSLLNTFESIVTKSRLLYTTHSHHLINPTWLNNTYIVRNRGVKYLESEDYDIIDAEIEAKPYRQFASEQPDQTSYFQPILDSLDYRPGLLENIPNIVVTEGKFDSLTLKYFKDVVLLYEPKNSFGLFPGQSASKLDTIISLYESWGRDFIVILDSDKMGKAQKRRYIKNYSSEKRIFDLQDISSTWNNLEMEDIFNEEELLNITKEFNQEASKYNKSAFNTGISILMSEKRTPDYISAETKEKFKKILIFLDEKFNP